MDDLFEQEARELSEAFEKRKLPILQKRDQIIAGTLTDFEDSIRTFSETQAKLEVVVAGIVKTEEELKAEK